MKLHSLYEAMGIVAAAQRKGKPRKRIKVQTVKGPIVLLNPRWDMSHPMDLAGDVMVSVAPRYSVSFTNA
jgi:hypothetical protein